jgi:hypothetical protein
MASEKRVGFLSLPATSNATVDIRPPAGTPNEEWTIHNISYSGTNGAIAFQMTDGTNVVEFDSDSCPNTMQGRAWNLTNAYWLRIRNTTANAVLIAYDGVKTN